MRIKSVQSARKPQGPCESCDKDIEVGTGYRWIQARYGDKRKRHLDCPTWRRSELTGSKLATVYAGQEAAHDALDVLSALVPETFDATEDFSDQVTAVLQEAADAARECAEDYQGGLDNMPDNLRDSSPTAEESQEKIDALETYADELESWDPDEPPERDDESEDEPDQSGEITEWAELVLDSAREAVDALDV